MKTFLRRWALASAGFALLELATRPPRRDVLSDRAAAMLIDLADLDRELREGHPYNVPVVVNLWHDPRPPFGLCDDRVS